jgi:hypothetical protein
MIRTQISLTEAQMGRLRQEAKARGTSIAAVIRDAVDQVVPDEREAVRVRRKRALAMIGAFASGARNTSAGHDEVLGEDTRW